jgi:hypothetical protein
MILNTSVRRLKISSADTRTGQFYFIFFTIEAPDVGLEPTAVGLKVQRSAD